MPQHYHFVVNPVAGGSTSLHRFSVIEKLLAQENIPYSAVYSEYPGHASALTRQALAVGHSCVVAAGGDGTVREVAQEMIHTGTALGILPLGTGNDITRALGIPREPEQALARLLAGAVRPIDTMEVNGMLCLNAAGLGFDVEVLRRTQRFKNRFRGTAAYLLGAVHALAHLCCHRVRITADGSEWEEEVVMVTVGNGTSIGGGMRAAPRADMGDGLIDLCVIRRGGVLSVLGCLIRLIGGNHLEQELTYYRQVEKVEILCEPAVAVQLDGEIVAQTPATFQVRPRSLHIVAGEERAPDAEAVRSRLEGKSN